MTAAMVAPLTTALPSAADDTRYSPPVGQQHSAEETKALTQAADSGEPVELVSHRTETSQVFANPTGTFTEERYSTAQWARQGNRLVDINTSLSVGEDGKITPKATTVGLEFSGGGEGPLATITRDGRSISLSWPRALPEPQIANDTVTYPDVLPDVDLKLRAGASGFAQLLVVKSARAAANPELKTIGYEMSSDGVNVTADDDGNLSAVDPGGQELFTAPTPRMWDSSTDSTGGSGLRSATAAEPAPIPPHGDEFEPGQGAQQAALPIEITDGSLRLTPDAGLMTGGETTYPVYIDPYVEGSRYSWTIAYKKYPGSSFYNGAGWGGSGSSTATARAGYENETNGLARSYFRMNTKNLWSTKKQVIKSTFRIKNTWSWSCTAKPVEVWRTDSIDSSTTWNNRPTRREKLATVTDAKGWSSSCPAGNLAFNVTPGAADAAASKWNTVTFELAASNESDVYGWKKFDARSAVLSTEYNTLPNAPTAQDTSPISTRNSKGCGDVAPYGTIGNTDFYLTAKVSDSDGGTVKAQFQLWATGHHDEGPGVFFDKAVYVTSGTVAKVKVTRAELKPHLRVASGNFSWKVQAEDNRIGSAWTPAGAGCRFVFDPNRPSIPPGIVSPQFPDGSEGWPTTTGQVRTAGSFTFSSGGVKDVKKYEYWTDTDTTVRTVSPTAAGGSVTKKIIPTASGANHVYAHSVDGAGNKSDRADYLFYVNGLQQADAAGDINGDGNPDLWAVDKDGVLRRFYGAGDGTVTEASSHASNGTWNGTRITHRGDWTGDGYEDLISLGRDETTGSKRLWIHPNDGDGFACSDCPGDTGNRQELTTYETENDHWQTGDQILAVGDVDGAQDLDGDGTSDIPGFPDLLVKEGNLLWLYFGGPDYRLDGDREPILIGNDNWKNYDLFAPGDTNADGRVDLGARDRSTGELFIFRGTGDDGDGLADHSTKVRTGRNFTPAVAPMITSPGDADHSGLAFDLWLTLSDNALWTFLDISGGNTTLTKVSDGWGGYQTIS